MEMNKNNKNGICCETSQNCGYTFSTNIVYLYCYVVCRCCDVGMLLCFVAFYLFTKQCTCTLPWLTVLMLPYCVHTIRNPHPAKFDTIQIYQQSMGRDVTSSLLIFCYATVLRPHVHTYVPVMQRSYELRAFIASVNAP